MGMVPAKCTECGAAIEIDDSKEAGICKHCGTAFITEKAINNYITNNIVTNNFTKIINGKEQDAGEEEFAKAFTNIKLKKYDRALENFDKAIKASPEVAKYYLYAVWLITNEFKEPRFFFEEPYFDEDTKRNPYYPISDFFSLAKEQDLKILEKEFSYNLHEGVEGLLIDILHKNTNDVFKEPKNITAIARHLLKEKYKNELYFILDELLKHVDELDNNPVIEVMEFLQENEKDKKLLESYQIFKYKFKEDKNGNLTINISIDDLYQREEKVRVSDPRVKTILGTSAHFVLTPNILELKTVDKKDTSIFRGIIEIDPTCKNDMRTILCGNRKSVNIFSPDGYWGVGSAYGIVVLPENMKEVNYTFYRQYEEDYVVIYAKGSKTKISAKNIGGSGSHKCVVVQGGKVKHMPIFASFKLKTEMLKKLKKIKEIYPDAY